jgi:hypothetical protein
VLVMLVVAYNWIPRPQGVKTNNLPLAKDVPPKVLQEAKNAKKHEPRNALTALTERMADATRDHAQVVLVAANLDDVERFNELPGVNPSVREASQEVTDGVRAVTHNARKAFDFFARELPMPELGEQKN